MQATSIKQAMIRLAATGFILAAASAQADWSRGDRDTFGPVQALRQSQQLTQQVDARQAWQLSRIEAGRRDGELTRGEVRALMRQQDEIAAMEQHFLADGRLDPHEFRRLDEALDEAGRAIRAERHDQQARYYYRDYHPRYN